MCEGERAEAVQLSRALKEIAEAVRGGGELAAIEGRAMQALAQRGWQPDYLTVRRRLDLQPPATLDGAEPLVALAAA
ncbi:pantoate--beta-alanine ligase, partial [Xylella fastidiosa]|uniref:pantoate--beta-alanine ligase n=1 Tax=Xylella fastidiosa TaxID=2371 RepID=UPI0030CDB417